jgi:hypothetical protein
MYMKSTQGKNRVLVNGTGGAINPSKEIYWAVDGHDFYFLFDSHHFKSQNKLQPFKATLLM